MKNASFAPRGRPGVVLAAAIAVAGVLAAGPAAGAEAPAPPAEQRYLETNPKLYAAARAYFPSDARDLPTKRIFRLTRDQIDASVATLLPGYFKQSIKARMAKDPLQTNYEFAELLSFNAANFGALSSWIGDIAARVRENPSGVINCASANNAPECLKPAARAFIVKAFRGDVSEEKINRMVGFYVAGVQSANFNQATAEFVELVLNSPDFLFRKEFDVDKYKRLVPAQLLQSVTYTAADAPPEKLQLNSQSAGQYLKTGVEAGATIAKVVGSKESRDKIVRFFKSWLEIKEPGEFTISQKVFPEFDAKFTSAMLDETNRFLRVQVAKASPNLKDITQAVGPAGAAATVADPAQRLGIFSQPAVLASHSGPTDTRPIKRGVFWVRKVMCMEMAPPPPELHAKLYAAEGATERERIEQSTERTPCIGCHKVINPLGFFQENYDALGRWRTRENSKSTVDVDSSIMIDFLGDAEAVTKTAGPVDALKTLTGSLMFKQCFVRQMFRFYMGRREEPSDDPLLRRMFFEFANNDSQDILTMVYLLSSSDRIVKRQ